MSEGGGSAGLRAVMAELDRGALAGHVVNRRLLAANPGDFRIMPSELDERLVDALQRQGVTRLYSHQAEALTEALSGRHLLVVTPTASGKSLCYNLPVLNVLLREPSAHALFLFPTKALAQDQLSGLGCLCAAVGIGDSAAVYDGDTARDTRRRIRDRSRIVLSNPDMLHTGILPHHTRWRSYLSSLRFVVLDELHMYTGVFGSHLANVLRRLRRICRFYGSSPTFICSSATIGNPGQLAGLLLGEDVRLIARNGAPSGDKWMYFLNPPMVDPRLGIRRGCLLETTDLAEKFLRTGVPTIVFARSRTNVEVLLKELRDRVRGSLAGRISAYRGGYLASERRRIEAGLRSGEILMVVATNALEVGIDIGSLDACIMSGYPGTITSTWQQAGRAGRTRGTSLAVLVASADPLAQFIVNNPAYFFGERPEFGLVNPENLLIKLNHIKCAAFELPFDSEEKYGGEDPIEFLSFLQDQGVLHRSDDRWHWMSDSYPAEAVSLRSVSAERFSVREARAGSISVLGEVDFDAAPAMLHAGAVYLHGSGQYLVEEFDYRKRQALVRAVDSGYFTRAVSRRHVRILDVFAERLHGTSWAGHGEVHVSSQVVGYKKIKFHTMETIATESLEMPVNEMHSTAYWCRLPLSQLMRLGLPRDVLEYGIMGLGNLLHQAACGKVMCGAHDLLMTVADRHGSWSLEQSLEGLRRIDHEPVGDVNPDPAVFLIDAYPGGIGFSEILCDAHLEILASAISMLRSCPCIMGCPSCTGVLASAIGNPKLAAGAVAGFIGGEEEPS